MEWNNTANNDGIFQDIDFLCATNSADFPITDKTRLVNKWYDFVVAEILDSMDEWDFQGDVAYSNLVANQQAYAFPTEILKIKRVEIDYEDDDKYIEAEQIDSSTIDSSIATSAQINNYFPKSDPKFDAWAHSAFLYPVPDAAVNSGLIIWHEENVTHFTAVVAQNTAEPAFDRPFHRILSLGASLDWAKKFQVAELITFCERELYGTTSTRQGRVGGLITKLRKHYGTKSSDKILQLKTRYYDIDYK